MSEHPRAAAPGAVALSEPVVPAGAATPVLTVAGVTVRFGGLQALSGVSLDMYPGRITGLVGPNGAGKSTLFDVMSGFLVPAEGEVLLDGKRITRVPPHRRARMGIVRSFQRPDLFQSLSVAEHLLLGYRMKPASPSTWQDLVTFTGWRGASALEREAVDSLLDRLNLTPYADREVGTLSTGITRLVEVGRVLALNPRVVLLDEPAAGLDHHETAGLRDALLRSTQGHGQGVALLVVEHDLEFVLGLSHTAYVLDAGRLIASGSPAAIRTDPVVIAAYLGDHR